jgi:hypothetical protein
MTKEPTLENIGNIFRDAWSRQKNDMQPYIIFQI